MCAITSYCRAIYHPGSSASGRQGWKLKTRRVVLSDSVLSAVAPGNLKLTRDLNGKFQGSMGIELGIAWVIKLDLLKECEILKSNCIHYVGR